MQPLMKALAWTFVHSLWQGLLAAFLAAIIISATKKTTAKLRYNLLGIVLVSFLAAVFISFFIQWQQQQPITALTVEVADIPGSNSNDNISTTVASEGFIVHFTNWLNNNTGLVLLVWVLFFSFNCLKLVVGFASVNRLRNYKVHPVTAAWKIKAEQLRDSLGIRQSITLLQSELIKVPVALGYFKPMILLPLGLMANIPPEQVETILLHELGHIRRRDYLVNFIQHFAEAIFFFNPGMLWLSSLLRQEREACCDDIVVTGSHEHEKINYLNALVAFQEYSMGQTPYAMAITNKRHYLLSRVERMLTNENKGINLFEKAALLAGIVLFSAFTFITQEKEAKESVVQHLPGPVLQNVTVKPVVIPVKKEKIVRRKLPVVDTLPAKKDTTKIAPPVKSKPPLPTKKDWENAATGADKALQEIIEIKEQIGIKKESIGKKKEQLKEKEGKDKDAILQQIEKERGEIEGKRGELEKKRAEYGNLKKQEQKNREGEIKQAPKAEPGVIYNNKVHITKSIELAAEIKLTDTKFKLTDTKVVKQDYQLKTYLLREKLKTSLLKKKEPPQKADEPKPIETPAAPKMKIVPAAIVRI